MKKFISIILALLLIICMAVPICAATPAIKIPHIEIPDITVSVRQNVKDIFHADFWNRWFDRNRVVHRYG